MTHQRYYQLDWLRVIAFGILIYFHAAVIFIPDGLPLIQNDQTSVIADLLVNISHQFRLGLLFLISGAGVAFAFKRRNLNDFLAERSKRLLLPLIIGIIVIVPIAVYFERLHLGQFSGSLLEFYPTFFTQGIYPSGNLSWHHLWFVAYLYIFCIISARYFAWCKTSEGNNWLNTINNQFNGYKNYRYIIVLLIPEILLRAFFPGFRDLIHDWASFTHWFLLFIAGSVIAQRPQLLNSLEMCRHMSLLIAILSTSILFIFFYRNGDLSVNTASPTIVFDYLAFCVLRMCMIWSCLLTCIGFANKYFQFNHPVLSYLNQAIYPVFILHLSIMMAIAYWVTPLSWPILPKYMAITTATIIVGITIYHVLIKPYNSMRLIFGLSNAPNNKDKRLLPEPID